MNKNNMLDMWMTIPRGQRRVLMLLVCIIVILSVVQVVVSLQRNSSEEPAADYSLLEQEIADFRSQLDTIPLDERRPVYVRRTNVEPDTAVRAQQTRRKYKRNTQNKQQHTPRAIESMQRVGDAEK